MPELVLIAIHKMKINGKEITDYRVLDVIKQTYIDLSAASIPLLMKKGKDIKGITLKGDKVIATYGAFNRYPILVQNTLVSNSSITIIKKLANGNFIVSDYKGQVVEMTEENLINYGRVEGISNMKIQERHLSEIKGKIYTENPQSEETTLKYAHLLNNLAGNNNYVIENGVLQNIQDKEQANAIIPLEVVELGRQSVCTAAHTIMLPKMLKRIQSMAFYMLCNVTELVIPNGVMQIETGTFYMCKNLRRVELPPSVKLIKSNAFMYCNKLNEVVIGPKKVKIEYLGIPKGVAITYRR